MSRSPRPAIRRLVSGVILASGVLGLPCVSRSAVAHDRPLLVAPVDELEVLDPHVDSEGKPRAIVVQTPGGPQIDIPPTVIVHRYYYTGDRSFQGPLLRGGPCVLVVDHPRSGERCYVDAMLLPGAPRISYTRQAILYDYGTRSMTICFGLIDGPTVSWCNGLPPRAAATKAVEAAQRHTEQHLEKSGVANAARTATRGARDAVHTAGDRLHDAGRAVLAPVKQIVDMLPVTRLLSSSPEDRAANERDRLLEGRSVSDLGLEGTIPTNR